MAKDIYLIALAVAAGAALFFVGVYALEDSSDDREDREADGTVKITLTIQAGLEVRYNGELLASEVPFYVSGDAELSITLQDTGSFTLNYTDSGTGGDGKCEGFGYQGDVLSATITVSSELSGDITGSVTFEEPS
ncbi:MAG: hypothetical protein LBB30_01185 [Candidatus Methanoplasma sp.]|jgi:hypothetical protein|nr:hypothetical protein [Candidatus Methanoplasma sp.]